MNPKQINSGLSISPQLSIADVKAVDALGFRSIIVNRPDGEEAGQPSIAEMRQAASAAGVGFATIPVVPSKITDEDAAQFAAALETLEGPVIAYCRTGVRAATLWALSSAPALGPDGVLTATAAAGYDLGQLRPRLEERYASARSPSATASDAPNPREV
jgi:uncharacterized protein (TIGR01244 family)